MKMHTFPKNDATVVCDLDEKSIIERFVRCQYMKPMLCRT